MPANANAYLYRFAWACVAGQNNPPNGAPARLGLFLLGIVEFLLPTPLVPDTDVF